MIASCGRSSFQRGQDVAQVGLGGQFHRRVGQAKPLRAHPHLGAGLLARDVDASSAPARRSAGGLQQQGRFADARIAAHQHRRGGTSPPPSTRSSSSSPAGGARRRRFLSWPGSVSATARPRRAPAPSTAARRQRRLLDDGVPCAAGVAAPRPFGMDGAAGGAGETRGFAMRSLCPLTEPGRKRCSSGDGVGGARAAPRATSGCHVLASGARTRMQKVAAPAVSPWPATATDHDVKRRSNTSAIASLPGGRQRAQRARPATGLPSARPPWQGANSAGRGLPPGRIVPQALQPRISESGVRKAAHRGPQQRREP